MIPLLVTYDLLPPVQDYDKILDVIKKYDFAMLCKSSYVVNVESFQLFWKEITSAIDESTQIYVFTLNQSLCFESGASEEVKEWLNDHLG